MDLGGVGSSKSREKTGPVTGWAAFDRRMKNNCPPGHGHHKDPFPPLHGHGLRGPSSSSPLPLPNLVNSNSSVELHLHENRRSSSGGLDGYNDGVVTIISNQSLNSKNETRFVYAMGRGVPIEPEWEEEEEAGGDLYLTHRKKALRAMRSACRHSKAASNAFRRGDRISAQQHRLESRRGYSVAQTLHADAASQIFAANNSDSFDLDLHGLHASEALHFLQLYLHRLETNQLAPSSSSSSSLRQKRPTSVQVITGIGNHSRGQASLPTAVRGFLNENGYHFEEVKPGVITVRLKFRISS